MATADRPMDRPPTIVRLVDPIARRLLRAGVPMGGNVLLTVRGRRSGEPRSAGVALVEIGERRWVISAYGQTHWVRNLRAAGEAELRVRGHARRVAARELTPEQAEGFFRADLLPYVASLPLPLRLVGRIFVGEIQRAPAAAARRRPVFELVEKRPRTMLRG
jgi:deazaflavin-dependent oxidoreductase (nitroreductase family)